MIFARTLHNVPDHTLTIETETIQRVESTKFLGIIIDESHNWSDTFIIQGNKYLVDFMQQMPQDIYYHNNIYKLYIIH
jgi:hypothetical protein